MKFGKIVACILFFVFFCGFKVDYDLTIDDRLVLSESVKFVFEDDNNDFVKSFNTFLPVDKDNGDYISDSDNYVDINYYQVEKNDNFSSMNFIFDHSVKSLNNDFFSNYCYKYVTVMNSYNEENERDELLISTSNKFLCFDGEDSLESVTIKIHTKRDVFSNNADVVDGNDYIWNITRDDKDNASIQMVLSSTPIAKTLSFWERNLLFFIAVGVFLIGSFIYIILKKRSDKVDEI